jgi:CheY-like chemotaxis protein
MTGTIVIVEDDVWLGEHYARVLERAGFIVHYTSSAIEAIDKIDEVKPDVIVLDILLAATTGLTLLHELQSHGDLATIPVIICTNSAADIDLKQLRPYGVRRVLDKTIMHPDDLVVALKSVLL